MLFVLLFNLFATRMSFFMLFSLFVVIGSGASTDGDVAGWEIPLKLRFHGEINGGFSSALLFIARRYIYIYIYNIVIHFQHGASLVDPTKFKVIQN